MNVIFIRHAESEYNRDGIWAGRADCNLTEKGIETAKELGKSLVSVQIILSAILSLALILSPFVQKALSLHFPLFLIPLTLFISIKVLIVIINGISLNKQNDLHKNLKINYL